MPDLYNWIDTEGGPFLLLAEELLPSWRGTEGWSFETHGEDESDYSRACDTTDWIGRIRCGGNEAYVLGGDVGPISWITSKDLAGGFLVQWLGVDDEAHIIPALLSKQFEELVSSESAEHILIEIGEPGNLKIIQAADTGSNLKSPNLSINLKSGTYCASSVYFETETLMIVVRRLEFQ
ncbi:Imm21 family immunity protein [Parasphingorhabdus sp.]|uniref:Imm21 family immunity protein n=1 Tax=Parasphingorhabdus sp. TaxID=2709688 RepID=UPI003D2D850F